MYTASYLIGAHLVRLSSAFSFDRLLPSFAPFCVEEEEQKAGLTVRIKRSNLRTLPADCTLLTEFEWEEAACRIFSTADSRRIIQLLPEQSPLVYTAVCHADYTDADLYLHGKRLDAFVLNNFLMMLYAFATAPTGTLLLHASVVIREQQAYAFLGKSGTGKSTHTKLWLDHLSGTELLNDDNPIVRLFPESKEATIYGSPWSGKTPCYRNLSAPLGALVRLEQAPMNEIVRLSAAYSFAAVFPSCSCLRQEERVNSGVIEGVKQLLSTVPVYQLRCLPDEEAARLCSTTIVKPWAGKPRAKQLPGDVLLPEIARLIGQGHTVTLTVKGNSMNPFFVDSRDSLTLAPFTPEVLRRGTVVLARTSDHRVVFHRIVRRRGNELLLQGDGNVRQTELSDVSGVMGVLVVAIRKGKEFPVSGTVWRVYSFCWMGLRPARRWLLALYRRCFRTG
ncbi:MAG: S24/S26 family peptidase [Prevotellaceae bacterium]|jgi:hypothetical protein|nr:S24/S26 family peptidase [Prevotellaceae bacterium]